MKTVIILLSTYNGEKYLRTQLVSILEQKNVDVKILVRDDGSTDSTLQILQEYAHQNKLSYYTGPNLGPAKSFMDLIDKAPSADYYAFSDQDDYWCPNKLSRAIGCLVHLEQESLPLLYASKALWVDKELVAMDKQPQSTCFTSFNQAVISSQAIGCTLLFNNVLGMFAKQYMPSSLIMHDAWLHKLCLAVGGKVVYDTNALIYYRQHDKNVCGGELTLQRRIKRHILGHLYIPQVRFNMLSELLKGYGEVMPAENRKILKKVLDYRKGWKYKWDLLKDTSIRTGNSHVDFSFILNIILGRF